MRLVCSHFYYHLLLCMFCAIVSVTCVNGIDFSDACAAAVPGLYAGCPALTRLLNLTDAGENDAEIEVENDIANVLDSTCCEGLKILQAERCLCDSGFVALLKSGKPVDDFTLHLLSQSIYFECGLAVEFGSSCDPQVSLNNLMTTSSSSVSYASFPADNSSSSSDISFTNTKAAKTSTLSPPPMNSSGIYGVKGQPVYNPPPLPPIVRGSGQYAQAVTSINTYDIQKAQGLAGSPEQLNVGNQLTKGATQPSYDIFIQPYAEDYELDFQPQQQNNSNLTWSQNYSQFIQPDSNTSITQEGLEGSNLQEVMLSLQISDLNSAFPSNQTTEARGYDEKVGSPVYSIPLDVQNLQGTPKIVYPRQSQFEDEFAYINANDTHPSLLYNTIPQQQEQQFQKQQYQYPQSHENYNIQASLAFNTSSTQLLSHENVQNEEGEYRKEDMVLKGVDDQVGYLRKQPFEQENVDYDGYSMETYVSRVVGLQRQKYEAQQVVEQGSVLEAAGSPQDEIVWSFRGARRGCDGSVLDDVESMKGVSIIGQCMLQMQNKFKSKEPLIVVAPRNSGLMSWLKTETGHTLAQFFENSDMLDEFGGRHIAVGQTLNLKSMLQGQEVNLKSLQGTPLNISLEQQNYYVNGIKVDIVHNSCDGIILVISSPIHPPYFQQTKPNESYNYQSPPLTSQSSYQDEAATILYGTTTTTTTMAQSPTPSVARFKLTPVDPLEAQYEVVSSKEEGQGLVQGCGSDNLYEVLKGLYPGFAYLASQQGMKGILVNSSDVTVFVPGTQGDGIRIEDYIMTDKLQYGDIAWLGSGTVLSMVSGNRQEIKVSSTGDLHIGGSQVTAWDKQACNGVLHVLDRQFSLRDMVGISLIDNYLENSIFGSSPSPSPLPPLLESASQQSSPPLTVELRNNMYSLRQVQNPYEHGSDHSVYAKISDMIFSSPP